MPELLHPVTGGRFECAERAVRGWLARGWQIAPPPVPKPVPVEPSDPASPDAAPEPTEPAPDAGEATTEKED